MFCCLFVMSIFSRHRFFFYILLMGKSPNSHKRFICHFCVVISFCFLFHSNVNSCDTLIFLCLLFLSCTLVIFDFRVAIYSNLYFNGKTPFCFIFILLKDKFDYHKWDNDMCVFVASIYFFLFTVFKFNFANYSMQ